MSDSARLTAKVDGDVQGVGFRGWVRERARELGLVGSAENLSDGGVEVVAEGPRSDCESLLDALRGTDTPGQVNSVDESWSDAQGGLADFVEQ